MSMTFDSMLSFWKVSKMVTNEWHISQEILKENKAAYFVDHLNLISPDYRANVIIRYSTLDGQQLDREFVTADIMYRGLSMDTSDVFIKNASTNELRKYFIEDIHPVWNNGDR